MKILYSVGKLISNHSLEEQVKLAKEAGFDGIDYIPNVTEIFFKPTGILSLSRKHNIPIFGVHIPLLLVPKTPRVFYKTLFKYVCSFPDCRVFNVHLSGFLTPLDKRPEKLKQFISLAQQNNIPLSFESNPDEYFIFKYYPKATWEPCAFAEYCIIHNLPMNLDTSHISSWGYNPTEFLRKYALHVNLFHLSDCSHQRQHLPFGKGALDLRAFFKEMKRRKVRSDVIFEVFQFPKEVTFTQRLSALKDSLRLYRSI